MSNGYHQKEQKKYWQRCEEKGTLVHCWWECKIGATLMDNSIQVSQKTETRATV